MIFILACVIIVLLIFISYLLDRKYPNKRLTITTGIFLAMLSVIGLAITYAPIKPIILSDEQRASIIKQQPIFAEWYGEYQQKIHHIHRFTTAYQRIINDYLNQQISAQAAKEQLEDLYGESQSFTTALDKIQPPQGLSEENTLLTQNIIKQTKNYQYHINEMIRQSISIFHTGIKQGLAHKDTSNNLIRIKALEDPIILDNAKYLAKINENLTVPKLKKANL